MQTITAAGAADVIAFAWYRMGYRPRESVLLVGLYPRPGGALCGAVLRVDIPPSVQRPAALDRIMQILARTGHDAVIALIVSDRSPRGRPRHDDGPLRHRSLALAVRASGRRGGVGVVDVIGVDESRYGSYFCRDQACCPPQGRSIEEALTSRAAAASVTEGMTLSADESDLVADVAPVDDPTLTDELLIARPRLDAAQSFAVWTRLMGEPADARDPAAVDLADLCNALDDVCLRDAVLASAAGPLGRDGMALAALVLRGQAALAFARIDELAPDEEAIGRAWRVLAALARHAPPGRRAQALAVLSWLAWWQGRGATARLLTERALADVADHRLATLVDEILTAMVAPPWVERTRAALSRAPSWVGGAGEW